MSADRAAKDKAEMEALILRDFPPHFMEPWGAKVADAGLRWSWEARMLPLSLSGEPRFTLTHSSTWGPTAKHSAVVRIAFSGEDQDILIETARAIEVGWPL